MKKGETYTFPNPTDPIGAMIKRHRLQVMVHTAVCITLWMRTSGMTTSSMMSVKTS